MTMVISSLGIERKSFFSSFYPGWGGGVGCLMHLVLTVTSPVLRMYHFSI